MPQTMGLIASSDCTTYLPPAARVTSRPKPEEGLRDEPAWGNLLHPLGGVERRENGVRSWIKATRGPDDGWSVLRFE